MKKVFEENALKDSPMAIFHKNLKTYNMDWSLEQIAVFEKLLLGWREFGNKRFYYQRERLTSELHIGKSKLKTCLDFLVESGYLNIIKGEKGEKNLYSFNVQKLAEDFSKIYTFEKMEFDDDLIKTAFIEKKKRFFVKFITTAKSLESKTQDNFSVGDYLKIHSGNFDIVRPDNGKDMKGEQN